MGQDYLSCGLFADEEIAEFPALLSSQASVIWCTAIPPSPKHLQRKLRPCPEQHPPARAFNSFCKYLLQEAEGQRQVIWLLWAPAEPTPELVS